MTREWSPTTCTANVKCDTAQAHRDVTCKMARKRVTGEWKLDGRRHFRHVRTRKRALPSLAEATRRSFPSFRGELFGIITFQTRTFKTPVP